MKIFILGRPINHEDYRNVIRTLLNYDLQFNCKQPFSQIMNNHFHLTYEVRYKNTHH